MNETISFEQNSLEEIVRGKLAHFLNQSEECDLANLYPIVVSQVEKPLIELLLRRSAGNQLRTARMLGINRNTLRKKIRELGIQIDALRTR